MKNVHRSVECEQEKRTHFNQSFRDREAQRCDVQRESKNFNHYIHETAQKQIEFADKVRSPHASEQYDDDLAFDMVVQKAQKEVQEQKRLEHAAEKEPKTVYTRVGDTGELRALNQIVNKMVARQNK